MKSMDPKNFNFDVSVKTLALIDDVKLTARDVNVKLDVENPLFQPTFSQTDLPKIDTTKLIGLQLANQQFGTSEQKKGFKMTIYKKGADNERGEIVGECFCDWNVGDEENWSPDQPTEHTCNVYKFSQHIGVITVNLIPVKKCDEGKSARSDKRRISLVEEDGKLSVFHEMKDQLNPRDVFFVVGDKSCSEFGGGGNPLASCRGGNVCKTELDPARYRLVQGRLVKDFSIVPNCDHPDCCANMKDILEEFEDMFKIPIHPTGPIEDSDECSTHSSCPTTKNSDSSESKISVKVIKPRTYTDTPKKGCGWPDTPCGILFGPLKKRTVANPKTRKVSTSTSVHMPDCPKKPRKRMLPKIKSCKAYDVTCVSSETESDTTSSCSCESCHGSCRRSCQESCDDSCDDSCEDSGEKSCETSTESEESLEPVNVNSLVDKVLKVAKKYKEKEVIPQTCSAPDLVKSQFQLSPQNCPICCEDISWVQPNSPCPKCGFKPKIGLPVESTAYDETQTAEKILEKWNAEVDKFKRKKDINALGICLCSKSKECINCQLRRTSQKPLKEITTNVANLISVQKEIDKVKQREKAQQEVCQKNMVSHIVEEVLGQPPVRATMEVANMLVKQESEPNFTEAFKWVKNQWPKNKKILDSTSDLSNDSRTNILKRLHNAAAPDPQEYKHSSNTNLRKYKEQYFEQCKQRDRYPPHAYGHYYCKPKGKLVPKNMGWYWSLSISKDRFGWRPGAIRQKTCKIMAYFKQRKAAAEAMAMKRQMEEVAKALEKPKDPERPRLHVKKQKGQYVVTVHPLHDPNIPECERPERMKPVQFTIDKAISNDKRRQIKQCLRYVETCQDDIDFECCTEDPEIASAIKNLKDLLGFENLRNILESESESEGSIDIELGGGAAPKVPTKVEVGAQVEEDFNEPVKIPKKVGMFYKNPYDGKCYGPLDEKPSDSELKPKPIRRPRPRIRFLPRIMPRKPRRDRQPEDEEKKPSRKNKKEPENEKKAPARKRKRKDDPNKKNIMPFTPFSSLGKPGTGKKPTTEEKEKVTSDQEIPPGKQGKGGMGKEKTARLQKRSTVLKKKKKKKETKTDSKKLEKPEVPPESLAPDFDKPPKPAAPKKPGSGSSTTKKAKAKAEKPAADVQIEVGKPPAKRLYTGPKKQPDRFIYDASKFERKKRQPCDIFDPCITTPLTKVRFKAHESREEFASFHEMLMCTNELCSNRVVRTTPAVRLMKSEL